jgi:integrase
MAREIERLTAKQVQHAKNPGYYHDGGGLYLQVSAGLSKSWIFRYTLHGKTREMGLGSFNAFSLADARERAKAQRQLLADGKDPITVRDAEKASAAQASTKSLTFAECATRYIAAQRSGWKNAKHAEQWTTTLETYAAPVIGKCLVRDVTTEHVKQILEPIWTTKPETATRVRSRIEGVINWAVHSGYRPEGPNPARWKGHLALSFPKRSKVKKVKNHPSLSYSQMAAFMQELRAYPGTAARALEFAILNANRTGEVRGAKPEEVSDDGIWIIPPERMKAEKEHRVPLSQRSLEIVREQKALGGKYLFPGRSKDEPLSQQSMLMVVRRLNDPLRWKDKSGEGIVPHGFRATFRTWAAEQTSYPHEMCEIAIAHTQDDKTVEAYFRSDMMEKRRDLMQAWANYCDGRDNVSLMKKAA